jgi:hypothetical protein
LNIFKKAKIPSTYILGNRGSEIERATLFPVNDAASWPKSTIDHKDKQKNENKYFQTVGDLTDSRYMFINPIAL